MLLSPDIIIIIIITIIIVIIIKMSSVMRPARQH